MSGVSRRIKLFRQYSLRTVLLLVMLAALLVVIALIGGLSLRRLQTNLESAARAQRTHAASQVRLRTLDYLDMVEQQTAMSRQFFTDGVLSPDDLQGIAQHWESVLRFKLFLTSLSVSLDADGQLLEVSRLANGRLTIRHLAPDAATGHLVARDYWPQDFPAKPYNVIPNKDDGDPRARPWYAAAVDAGRATWTQTYKFIGAGGSADRLGVTHASPLYRADGRLLGVLTTDVALDDLNRILAELIPPREGVGLIVERKPDGKPHLLAQSDTRRWTQLLPSKLRAQLGGDNVAAMLAGKVGETWMRGDSLERKVQIPNGELLLSLVSLESGHEPGLRPSWALVIFSLPDEHLLELRDGVKLVSLLIACIVVIASALSLALAQSISRPLASLAKQLERIGRLEFSGLAEQRSPIREVSQLSRSSQSMALSLRSFLKYVPASLVRQLVAGDEEARLGGEERELSVMFIDVAGFTKLTEHLNPEQLVELLGGLNELLAAQIESRGGTLDKFLGDGLMAFWGAPDPLPDHAQQACACALAIQRELCAYNAVRASAGLPPLALRIGIASGQVVVGNFGSSTRISYTAIGDVVNIAAALEQMNKLYGTAILLAPLTQERVAGIHPTRALDNLKLKGKAQALMIHELLPEVESETARSAQRELTSSYSFALQAYIAGNWQAAEGQFAMLSIRFPLDEAALAMLERCRLFRVHPPASWDGAFEIARISPTAG